MPEIRPGRLIKHWLRVLTLKLLKLFPARNLLQTLLHFDNALYYLENQVAIRYGKDEHPKHELTHYHRFFTERIQAGEKVLDVGCGIGALAYDIAQDSKASVLGIDINPQNIEIASRKHSHPHIQYMVKDILQEGPEGSFDVIVLSNILEHLPDRSKFIYDLQRTTHAKHFLIRVPLYERDWRVPLKQKLGIEWRLDPTHRIEYTLESFQKEMREARQAIEHLEVRWGEIWADTVPSVTLEDR